jgi:hypothetical protein
MALETEGYPADAISTGHTESLNALADVIRDHRRHHNECRSVDGCPWPIVSDFDVHELHARLIAAGYQVVPI